MNDFDPHLGPALRDRMQTETPDLEHLAASSLRAGTTMRRARRLRQGALVAGGAAAVAALAVVTSQVGGGATVTDPTPPVAAAPSDNVTSPPDELAVGQVLDVGNGLIATIQADDTGTYVLGASTRPGPGTGLVAVVSGPPARLEAWRNDPGTGVDTLLEQWPGLTVGVPLPRSEAAGMRGLVDEEPATPGAGWTCEWFLTDNKASCESTNGARAGLVIRDAVDRDAWVSDPDKGADPSVYTTEAHKGIFITVQAGEGSTAADIQELGASLVWSVD